jgi:hypothetical protein
MPKPRTFIVLEGALHENMEFEHARGFETEIVRAEDRAQTPDGVIVARLLDGQGQALVSNRPVVAFPSGCAAGPSRPGVGLVRVALARHPEARRVELLAHGRVIFGGVVGIEPPIIDFTLAPRVDGTVLQFRIESSARPDEIAFFLVDDNRRRMRAVPSVSEGVHSINLTRFLGHRSLRLSAIVSRDFRSSETVSDPFDLPEARLRARILSPANRSEWSANMPFSLIGNLSHESGKAAPWDATSVSWTIDGRALNDTRQIATCEPPAPGEHAIEIRHRLPNGAVAVLDRIQIYVREETADQKRHAELLGQYLETRTRRPSAARPTSVRPVGPAVATSPRSSTKTSGCGCGGA